MAMPKFWTPMSADAAAMGYSLYLPGMRLYRDAGPCVLSTARPRYKLGLLRMLCDLSAPRHGGRRINWCAKAVPSSTSHGGIARSPG